MRSISTPPAYAYTVVCGTAAVQYLHNILYTYVMSSNFEDSSSCAGMVLQTVVYSTATNVLLVDKADA